MTTRQDSAAPAPDASSQPIPLRPKEAGPGGHLHYVDVVRLLTVALVIAVHVLALEPIPATVAAGALLTVFHVSREVFFLLTAFVLTYGYLGRRSVRWPAFWRKRYLFVVVPYLLWTVIYFVADQPPMAQALRIFVNDVLTGAARYHLYFLLVSMQIYLVFPLLRQLLRVTSGHHGLLLALASVFQLAVYTAVWRGWTLGPFTWWLRYPDALLPSYLGFVVMGGLAAWHKDALVRWTRDHVWTVVGMCAGSVALGVGVYLAEVYAGGQAPLLASGVFQPVVVVESVAIAWLYLAIGLVWQDRGRPAGKIVRAGSDASFGVYLAHPLLLQGLLALTAATGITALAQHLPSGLVIAVEVLVAVPLLYGAAAVLAALARRTPVSLPLTGRAWLRPGKPHAGKEIPADRGKNHPALAIVRADPRPIPSTGGSR